MKYSKKTYVILVSSILAIVSVLIALSFRTPTWNDPCRTDIDRTGRVVYTSQCLGAEPFSYNKTPHSQLCDLDTPGTEWGTCTL